LAGPGKAQAVGNWIVNDLLRELGQAKRTLAEGKVRPAHIAALVGLVDAGTVLHQRGQGNLRRDVRHRR
jgi:aspartyl-tRNA(Asn)/glutamyl-tRNA(Gln) amidotransferase subunit B